MDIKRLRHISRFDYEELARALYSRWGIYCFYRAAGCRIRTSLSRAWRGLDIVQWLEQEQEKARRAELRRELDAARFAADFRNRASRPWHANPRDRKLLNHVSGISGGLVAVYQRHQFWDEQMVAINAWENEVRSLISTP
jgi:hypothetical protein